MIRRSIENFSMLCPGFSELSCHTPCSMYSVLLAHGQIPDPFIGGNEQAATVLSEKDCVFRAEFPVEEEILSRRRVELCFDGLDTLCEIALNGRTIAESRNMHRSLRVDVKDALVPGINRLTLSFHSPVAYIKRKQSEHYVWNSSANGSVMEGISHIRKALCMFGWDWGPKLPDMGIWKGISLEAYDDARFADVKISQRHGGEEAWILITPELREICSDDTVCRLRLVSPEGKEESFNLACGKETAIKITNRRLWWPNGLGDQPLYTLEFSLWCNGRKADTLTRTVGLRTLRLCREKDRYGSEFCFEINGKKIFAKGANYIPEDSVFPRITHDKTLKLLESCAKANFNCLRVWGGGYYPDEYFYRQCDRLGIIVWQDFMFACMCVYLNEDFRENVCAEIRQVLTGIRHHASLGVLCGNNEIEEAFAAWSTCRGHSTEEDRQDYLALFEKIIPDICREMAPDVSYISSTPSSFGHFEDPRSDCFGDTHTWTVWLKGHPVEDYGKIRSRFCSEFGFAAFPSLHTIRSFAGDEDQRVDSEVMRSHQKCTIAEEKIVTAVREQYGEPKTFPQLIYASQLVQADAIRLAVEHFRQNSDYCKGALYWQLNDCWPTMSWSSIDYFGRWKALHWKAAKFFAPVLLSVNTTDGIALNVSNETLGRLNGRIRYEVCDNSFHRLATGECELTVEEISDRDFPLSEEAAVCLLEKPQERFLRYALLSETGDKVLYQGTYIHCRLREYRFSEPEWTVSATLEENGAILSIGAASYQRDVALFWDDPEIDSRLQFFDLDTPEAVEIRLDHVPAGWSAEDIVNRLTVYSCYYFVS